MLIAYTDDAAFARAGVMDVDGENVSRRKAPILDSYAIPYSAYTLSLLEWLFPDQGQVTFSDFHDRTLWFDVCLWSKAETEQAFCIMERKGYIAIDRQMQPWIIERRASAHDVWQHIFDDLV